MNTINKKQKICTTTTNTVKLCMKCNKKLHTMEFKCKCDNYFCIKHHHSDSHECTYDYKTANKEYLKKTIPIISAKKIDTI